jgi:hypothetical protein
MASHFARSHQEGGKESNEIRSKYNINFDGIIVSHLDVQIQEFIFHGYGVMHTKSYI